MKFTFKVSNLTTRIVGNEVIDVKILVQDPATEAHVEFLGHLTMFKNQWDMLKSMLAYSTGFLRANEAEVEFEEE